MKAADVAKWTRLPPVLVIALLASCGRSPQVEHGPIEIDSTPDVVRFPQPVAPTAPLWETCFEFERPGDSQRAGEIHALLVTATDARVSVGRSRLDRKGESVVCLVGEVPSVEPSSARGVLRKIEYVGVELWSDAPLRLAGIHGGSRS